MTTNSGWEKKWQKIAQMLFGDEALRHSMYIYDMLKNLGTDWDEVKVIQILDQAERYSHGWEDISRAILTIGMASPEKIPELLVILSDLLDREKNPPETRKHLGISYALHSSNDATRCKVLWGVILGMFQVANYLDAVNYPDIDTREETSLSSMPKLLIGLILSPASFSRGDRMDADKISQQEQERWESCLSKELKTWVRGKHHQRQRLHEVREILYQVVTKSNDNETPELSLIGELLLDQISYAFYGPLKPLQKAKLVYPTIPWSPDKPTDSVVDLPHRSPKYVGHCEGHFDLSPTPPAEPQKPQNPITDEDREIGNEATAASHYDLGIASHEMGMFDDAIDEFQQAAKLQADPKKRADCLLWVAICQKEKGDPVAAINGLSLLVLAPGFTDLPRKIQIAVYYELMLLYFHCKRYSEAEEYAKKCLQLDPNFPTIETFLEKIQAEQAMKPQPTDPKCGK